MEPKDNVFKFLEKNDFVLLDEAVAMGRLGRKRVESEFSPEAHYAKLSELFAELLADKQRTD